MKNLSKKQKVLFIVMGLALVIFMSGFSYAYFVSSIVNTVNPSSTVFTTGTMAVEYDEGQAIEPITGWLPGDYLEKTFSVENTGNVTAYYNIYINEVVNTFVDKNDLVYALTSNDGGRNISQTIYPSQDTIIASNIEIGVGQTHHYTLRITFLETHDNQDNNRGATFSGKISLEETVLNDFSYTQYRSFDDSSQNTSNIVYSTPAALYSASGFRYMIKEDITQTYSIAAPLYAIKLYESVYANFDDPNGFHGYDSIEDCEADIASESPLSKAECYEENNHYFVSFYEINWNENTTITYDNIETCLEKVSSRISGGEPENYYKCEIYNQDEVGTKVANEPIIDSKKLCLYINNNLDCFDSNDGWEYVEQSEYSNEISEFETNHPYLSCKSEEGISGYYMSCDYNNEIIFEYFPLSKEFRAANYLYVYYTRTSQYGSNTYEECYNNNEVYFNSSNHNDYRCLLNYNDNKYYLHGDIYEYYNESECLENDSNGYGCSLTSITSSMGRCVTNENETLCYFVK